MESTPNPRVLVIMPAWNESEAVGNTVREVLNTDSRYDVLVVNDGSTDNTAAVAAEAGATVLNLPFNLGVGGAMRAGFKYARRCGYREPGLSQPGNNLGQQLHGPFPGPRDLVVPAVREARAD